MTFSMETVRIVKSQPRNWTNQNARIYLNTTLPYYIFIISMAVSHQNWEQRNSLIWFPEISN